MIDAAMDSRLFMPLFDDSHDKPNSAVGPCKHCYILSLFAASFLFE